MKPLGHPHAVAGANGRGSPNRSMVGTGKGTCNLHRESGKAALAKIRRLGKKRERRIAKKEMEQ